MLIPERPYFRVFIRRIYRMVSVHRNVRSRSKVALASSAQRGQEALSGPRTAHRLLRSVGGVSRRGLRPFPLRTHGDLRPTRSGGTILHLQGLRLRNHHEGEQGFRNNTLYHSVLNTCFTTVVEM